VIALVVGAALVAGGVGGAVAATSAQTSRYAAPIGFAVALMAIGLGMVAAGVARRRSGVLAFLAIVTLVLGLGSFGWPLHGASVGDLEVHADRNASVSQFAGRIRVDGTHSEAGGSARTVRVQQTFGVVAIFLDAGVDARVNVTSADSTIHPVVLGTDGASRSQQTITVGAGDGPRGHTAARSWSNTHDGSPELVVDIAQGAGAVYVYDAESATTNSDNG